MSAASRWVPWRCLGTAVDVSGDTRTVWERGDQFVRFTRTNTITEEQQFSEQVRKEQIEEPEVNS